MIKKLKNFLRNLWRRSSEEDHQKIFDLKYLEFYGHLSRLVQREIIEYIDYNEYIDKKDLYCL